jgi:hypothetical protein
MPAVSALLHPGHIASRPGVWFATHAQVAEYARAHAMTPPAS